ncbi:MAG: glycoside hydrolase family 3 N-terminal domain-containing protein [Balneolaceae bacterium]|nr:glycoside hydrolase family 3 N-terminal domain-containing protein [Balneolaceae bacterium]
MRILFLFASLFLLSTAGCSQTDPAVPTLEDKIGQMLMVGFRGMEVTAEDPIVEDIQQLNLGGIILFDYDVPRQSPERNIESPQQVRTLTGQLQSFSETLLLIGIDQEGGRVVRLKPKFGFPETVSAQYLGSLNNPDSTQHFAHQQAELISSLGINVNFCAGGRSQH